MPDLKTFAPQGMLHEGWTAQVDDYALACGWTGDGDNLLVGDVAGGLCLFAGTVSYTHLTLPTKRIV